jgi:hypothetical protein
MKRKGSYKSLENIKYVSLSNMVGETKYAICEENSNNSNERK